MTYRPSAQLRVSPRNSTVVLTPVLHTARIRSLRRMTALSESRLFVDGDEEDRLGMSVDRRCHDLLAVNRCIPHDHRTGDGGIPASATGAPGPARTTRSSSLAGSPCALTTTTTRPVMSTRAPSRRGSRALQAGGHAANTIAGRVSAVSAFYRWCVREQLCHCNPVDMIRRPRRPTESATASLTRHELTDWLAASEGRGGAWWQRRCCWD